MQKVNRLWFEFLNDVKVLWIRSDTSKVANTHTILIGNIECEFKDYLGNHFETRKVYRSKPFTFKTLHCPWISRALPQWKGPVSSMYLLWQLPKIPLLINYMGSFTNYVDKILAIFDHLPPSLDIFYGINVDKKSIFSTNPLVNIVCEYPRSDRYWHIGVYFWWICQLAIWNTQFILTNQHF